MKRKWIFTNEKGTLYLLDKKRSWDHYSKKLSPWGSLIGASIKGNKLCFFRRAFYISKDGRYFQPTEKTCSLVYKNGKFYIYGFAKRDDKYIVRDITYKIKDFLDKIQLSDKKAPKNRLIKVLNLYLKRNKIKGRAKKNENIIEFLKDKIYPGLPEYRNFLLCPGVAPFFKNSNLEFKELLRKFCGHDSKQITKLMAEALKISGVYLLLARGLKNLITIDDYHTIFTVLKDRGTWRYSLITGLDYNDIRNVFKNYSRRRIVTLLTSHFTDSIFSDTIRMYNQCKENGLNFEPPKDAKKLQEIHDYYMSAARKIKIENKEVPIRAGYEKICDVKLDNNLEIFWPKNTHTVIDMGTNQNHCIGTYADWFANGHCDLLGIIKDGELKYCIMISNKMISQFYGHSNSLPDKEDSDIIRRFLEENDIVVAKKSLTNQIRPVNDDICIAI